MFYMIIQTILIHVCQKSKNKPSIHQQIMEIMVVYPLKLNTNQQQKRTSHQHMQ